jgi:predicted PurR-regulated permease PerM
MIFDSLFFILLIPLFIIFFIFYKINEKLYKNLKFKRYIDIVTSVATFILALGVLFQVIAFKQQEHKTTIQTLNNFSNNYTNDIIQLFIQHPEMDYFYQELFFNKPIPQNVKRNIALEQQISMSILSKTVAPIVVINQYDNYQNMKTTLIKILNNFFKSPSFKYYYTDCYKPTLAGPIIITFMKENFGL